MYNNTKVKKLFNEAQAIIDSCHILPNTAYDEIVSNVFLSEVSFAKNTYGLHKLGITHIVNCCEGNAPTQVPTCAAYYEDKFSYLGIPCIDTETYNISQHFESTYEFINNALIQNGRVLVHCREGISRSATIVIAYLMYRGVDMLQAVRSVKDRRSIFPNDGFLQQLAILEVTLRPEIDINNTSKHQMGWWRTLIRRWKQKNKA